MTKTLSSLRAKIDKIDKKLQKHLLKREKIVRKIGEIKKIQSVKIENKTREKEILSKIESPYVKKIFQHIITESKEIQ